ncbi:MAG TPA: hypothetical protein VF976_12320 [Gemmatimonadales bacterium]
MPEDPTKPLLIEDLKRSYDGAAPQGAVRDASPLIAAQQAQAAPVPTSGIPAPAGGGHPGEGIGDGKPVMAKTYVQTVAGYVNPDIDPVAMNAAFTAPVDPAQAMKSPSGPLAPSAVQPNETIAGSTGAMVTESPSDSGTGAMVPGAGTRAPE